MTAPSSYQGSVLAELREKIVEVVMRETTDEIVADGWQSLGKPNVLVQGCRYIRGHAKGYEKPEEAARAFAGYIADGVLALLPYAALVSAAHQMLDDYQTSEAHHPQHVLVPLAAFEAMRSALSHLQAAGGLGDAPSKETSAESGWLIEAWNSKRSEYQAKWWGLSGIGKDGFGWTDDTTKALRFARKCDAQAYIDDTGWTEARPSEHVWSDPRLSAAGASWSERAPGDAPSKEGGQAWREVHITDELLSYVSRYGGMCRDCADEDGICPANGMACDPDIENRAIRHVINALNYGFGRGYLKFPPTPDATSNPASPSAEGK